MPFLLAYWRWLLLAALLVAAAAFGGSTVYRHEEAKLRALQSDFDAFRGGVAALGVAAKKAAEARKLADLKAKEDADRENAKAKSDLAGLYAAYASLRDQRTHPYSSPVPPAAPGSASPTLVTFDRAVLDRGLADADAILQGGAAKILLRGDTAIANLNTGMKWATSLQH